MRKSEHRLQGGNGDASAAATAPARQRVHPAPSAEQDNTVTPPEVSEPLATHDARAIHAAELHKKHAEGTYKVDARKVSTKIIDRHLEK